MWVWNKTFKTSQSCAWQPGFCDSKALFSHSFCCSLPGCQNLWLRDEGWIPWTRWCKGWMPTYGNTQGQALSGDRVPMEPVKGSSWKTVSGPANTVQNPVTSLTAFKDSSWLAGEKANSDRCVCFRSLTWQFALFMPGDERLNKGWSSWIWQWSFSQKPWACFQLRSKISSEPEAASCTDSHQWHSEWWLCLWGNGLFLCQDATSAPKEALSLRSHFSSTTSPQPSILESSCRFTTFLSPLWNILAC